MTRPWNNAQRSTPVAKNIRECKEHSEEVSRLGFVHTEAHTSRGKLVSEAARGTVSKGGLGFYNCKFSDIKRALLISRCR